MAKKKKAVSDDQAKKITDFLLKENIPQKKIADVVDRSQSWVSNTKKVNDSIEKGKEAGRKEVTDAIVKGVMDQAAEKISQQALGGATQPPALPQ